MKFISYVLLHPETGSEDVDWTHLAQDRGQLQALANMVMNIRVP